MYKVDKTKREIKKHEIKIQGSKKSKKKLKIISY
jgi:hypothetical protein